MHTQETEMRAAMNHFLVKVFNEILKSEEKAIGYIGAPSLSMREMHVIEQVCDLQNGDNRAAAIAANLRITAGTLTTSVSQLERKGYVQRIRDEKDKRVVHIAPTQKGINANKLHQAFHEKMIDILMQVLDPANREAFLMGLEQISAFFDKQQDSANEKG